MCGEELSTWCEGCVGRRGVPGVKGVWGGSGVPGVKGVSGGGENEVPGMKGG